MPEPAARLNGMSCWAAVGHYIGSGTSERQSPNIEDGDRRSGRRTVGIALAQDAKAWSVRPTSEAIAWGSADCIRPLLDPETYEGVVAIATVRGDVYAYVESGELPGLAAEVRQEIAGGATPDTLSAELTARLEDGIMLRGGGTCSTWQQAVGGPGAWWTSTDGCAVFGYPGYSRWYEWRNQSDVNGCAKGRGYNNAVIFYSLGCAGPGGGGYAYLPWGNVLMITKAQGYSLSLLTGMGYIWWD